MTTDEMILTLLRAVAEAMVCDKCGGTGTITTFDVKRHSRTGSYRTCNPCSCRIAVRAVLAADKVAL